MTETHGTHKTWWDSVRGRVLYRCFMFCFLFLFFYWGGGSILSTKHYVKDGKHVFKNITYITEYDKINLKSLTLEGKN